jgi:hypothetical protein
MYRLDSIRHKSFIFSLIAYGIREQTYHAEDMILRSTQVEKNG